MPYYRVKANLLIPASVSIEVQASSSRDAEDLIDVINDEEIRDQLYEMLEDYEVTKSDLDEFSIEEISYDDTSEAKDKEAILKYEKFRRELKLDQSKANRTFVLQILLIITACIIMYFTTRNN